MKNLLILFITIFSFTITAQTSGELEMINLVNKVRTNPKSFIPVVEAYIKTLETKPNPLDSIKIKGATVTKKIHSTNGRLKPLISEANALIFFLNHVKPVNALELSLLLYPIAHTQAEYMDSIKILTHNGSNGNKRYVKGFILCGENCAIGTTATEALLMLLIDSGNNTKSHRTNIFLKDFTTIAIGNKKDYWVQDFGY